MIYVIATLTVKQDKRDAFMADAQAVIAATRQEQGCLSYDLTASLTDAQTFVFVERWESRDALDAHFQTPHLQRWRDLCSGYVSGRLLEIIHPERVDAA